MYRPLASLDLYLCRICLTLLIIDNSKKNPLFWHVVAEITIQYQIRHVL